MNFYIILGINYFTEKYLRLNFYEKTKYQESLESFKCIIKSSLPVSVSILDKDKSIIFSNDATLELLNKPLNNIELDQEITLHRDNNKEFFDPDEETLSLKLIISEVFFKYRAKSKIFESDRFSNYGGFLNNILLEDGNPKPVDVLIGRD